MKKILGIAALTLAMTACGGGKEETKTANGEKQIKIGTTIYKYDDNFMTIVRQNISNIAKEDGTKLEMVDSQNDQSKQNDQVDVFLSKGVDVLAINLVDPAAAKTIIEKAKVDKLPVVFFNKEPREADIKSYDQAYYVGTDSKESGIIQGELIAKQWAEKSGDWDLNKDGKIQFVLFKGEPGHPDAEARTEWVIKTLNEKGIETEQLHLDTGMWDAAMAKDKMDAWITGPNKDKIEMVIANNDGMAFGAIEALKSVGKQLPVYGIDALPEALALVEKGQLAGTVLNDAENQARATYELAKNLANGKEPLDGTEWKFDDKKAVRVPYVGIDKENLAEFKK